MPQPSEGRKPLPTRGGPLDGGSVPGKYAFIGADPPAPVPAPIGRSTSGPSPSHQTSSPGAGITSGRCARGGRSAHGSGSPGLTASIGLKGRSFQPGGSSPGG